MPSEESTADWIGEAKCGKPQAIEALVQQHQGIIAALANRLRCEFVSREELVQAGYLGLMQAIARFDESHNVKLSTYALPWILGEMRQTIRRAGGNTYSLDQPMEECGYALYDVLEGGEGIDVDQLDLRLALCRLKADEQVLICLRYYRDKTQKEAAALLGKSQAQISKLENRALNALHAMLR